MKCSGKLWRKLVSAVLSAVLIFGAAVLSGTECLAGSDIWESEDEELTIVTYGDFDFELERYGTACIVAYNGKKDLSSSVLELPSFLYPESLDSDWKFLDDNEKFTVTGIEEGVFSGCSIKLVSLPQELVYVYNAFYGAEVGGYYITDSNRFFRTDNSIHAILDKNGTTLCLYPSKQSLYSSVSGTVFPDSVTAIAGGAFVSCKFTSMTIPARITLMREKVFAGSDIKTITFEGDSPSFVNTYDSIGAQNAFWGAEKLQTIDIKGKNGRYNTFNGAVYSKNYTTLYTCPMGRTTSYSFIIDGRCRTIYSHAFYGCSKLTAVTIPESVTDIYSSAFNDHHPELLLYVMPGSEGESYAVSKKLKHTYLYTYTESDDGTVTVTGYNGPNDGLAVPEAMGGKLVSAIGDSAFISNKKLLSVTIPEGVTSIGSMAFMDCTNLKTVNLPSTVTSIGDRAFYNSGITSFKAPASLMETGVRTFWSCKELKTADLTCKMEVIPDYAFGYCTSLESVTIPDNIKMIGFCGFYSCTSLSEVSLGSGLKTIGGCAFENTALKQQYIPENVTSVGTRAFGFTYSAGSHERDDSFYMISGLYGTEAESYAKRNDIPFNTALKYTISGGTVTITGYAGNGSELIIPSEIEGKPVTSISTKAFYQCNTLTSVTLPSGLRTIGTEAFAFCKSLKVVSLPQNVTSISNYAFFGCTSLKNFYFNVGLTRIGQSAFANTALTSVMLPRTLTVIDAHALGYTSSGQEYYPVEGFTVMGYKDTEAEAYAKENSHITFSLLYDDIINSSSLSSKSVNVGQSVTVTASASGGKAPFTYLVRYKRSGESGNWTVLQDYSVKTKLTFTPDKAGTYSISVIAKDSREYSEEAVLFLTAADNTALENLSAVSKTTVTLGESLTVTAKASGGTAPYLYGVYLKKATSEKWSTVQSYKSNSTIKVTPAAGVKYDLCVKVKDSTGKIAKKYYVINVVKPLTNSSTLSADTITKGETLTAYCKASGGEKPYLYLVCYKKSTSEKWSVVQSYKSNSTVKFKPLSAVKYDVCVKVKDTTGKIVKKYFTVTVNK